MVSSINNEENEWLQGHFDEVGALDCIILCGRDKPPGSRLIWLFDELLPGFSGYAEGGYYEHFSSLPFPSIV